MVIWLIHPLFKKKKINGCHSVESLLNVTENRTPYKSTLQCLNFLLLKVGVFIQFALPNRSLTKLYRG